MPDKKEKASQDKIVDPNTIASSTDNRSSTIDADKLISQIGQSFVTKILMILLRLVRNAILARVLGPADRGLFALIGAIPDLIMSIGNMGYSNSVAYYGSRNKNKMGALVGSTLLFCLSMGSFLAFVAYLVIHTPWLVKGQDQALIPFTWLIVFLVPILLFKFININLLTSQNWVGKVNTLSLMESGLPLILFLLLWWVFDMPGINAAVYSLFGTMTAIVIVSLFWMRPFFPPRFEWATQKQLAHYGVRGHFDTLFQKLLLRVDFVFVGAMLGTEALGYYAMATAAAELLLTIPTSITLPLFSFLMGDNDQEKEKVTPLVLRLIVNIMIVCSIGMAILGQWLILILFGRDYLPAYEPLVCLLPGIVFLSYASLIRLDMLGKNRPGTVSIISGSAFFLNMILNVIFIPIWGINGTAIASSICYGIAAVFLFREYRQITGTSALVTCLVTPQDIRWIVTISKDYINKKKAQS